MTNAIQYYYSSYSAYAYIGHQYFLNIAKNADRLIEHKPFNLLECLNQIGSQPLPERTAASLNYHFQRQRDRWSEFRNVKMPKKTPTSHSKAADLGDRVLIACISSGLNIDNLAYTFMSNHWIKDTDLTNADQIKEILISKNFEADNLLEAADTDKIRQSYKENTDIAIELSVFGSPTYFVDEDMFYGQDNLDLVERTLSSPFTN